MPTKLRSACDRCHQTKVRCSGDIPCQGCLLSRTLCFYSVSNPLGRPRGTKNSQGRGRARGNNLSRRESASSDNLPKTTQEQKSVRESLSSHGSGHYRKNFDDCMSIDHQTQNEIEAQQDNLSNTTKLSTWNSSEDLCFGPPSTGDHGYDLSDFLTNSVFASVPSNMMQSDLKETSPYDLTAVDANSTATMSDIAMSSYTSHSNSKVHTPDDWENVAFHLDKTAAELYDTSNTERSFSFQSMEFNDNMYHTMHRSSTAPTLRTPDVTASVIRPGPSMTPISQITTRTSTSPCSCLQQLAELMCNPRCSELLTSDDSDELSLSLDKALALVTQANKVWRELTLCPRCPFNNDQDVMLLAFMSIRAIVRYLRRLAPHHFAASSSRDGLSAKRGPSSGTDPVPTSAQPLSSGDSRMTIGSYEIEGDERILVYRALFQHMLKMVKGTLHSLQSIQDKRKEQLLDETAIRTAGEDDYQASSNMFLIQQISHKLFASIKMLELSLNGV